MSIISTVSSYVEKHEKMVLLAIAGLVLWFGIGKIDTLIANHDNANLQQAKVAAQIQADKVAAVAEQVQQQAQQYQILATKLDSQNAALVAANTQLATALAQRQKTDASLPPTELANRWAVLVPQAKPTVTATGLAVDTPGAIATVQQLEQVPVLSTQLGNERTQLGNTQALLTAEGGQVTTLNTEIGSLNVQLKDNQVVCNQQIAVVKALAAKSKRRWFYAGVVVGFIGRQLIKTYTGL
jgi:hypothetical protein